MGIGTKILVENRKEKYIDNKRLAGKIIFSHSSASLRNSLWRLGHCEYGNALSGSIYLPNFLSKRLNVAYET
jgi:hypothetical protein